MIVNITIYLEKIMQKVKFIRIKEKKNNKPIE